MHKSAPKDLILIYIQKADIKTKYHPPPVATLREVFHQTGVKLSEEGIGKQEFSGIVDVEMHLSRCVRLGVGGRIGGSVSVGTGVSAGIGGGIGVGGSIGGGLSPEGTTN